MASDMMPAPDPAPASAFEWLLAEAVRTRRALDVAQKAHWDALERLYQQERPGFRRLVIRNRFLDALERATRQEGERA